VPPAVLRPDCETLTWLAFTWSKILYLDACLTSSSSSRRFCGATDKPYFIWFWGTNQEIVVLILMSKSTNSSCQFWGTNRETRSHWFWDQTGINHPSGFEAKALTNRWPWFWGQINKLALLVSTCTVQTVHNVTRPLDSPITKYPTCGWSSSVLYTRSSTSTMIPVAARHAAPVTYTTQDK
jgi:hypothetical protein